MRKQLECICENCGKSYMKDASEVTRNIKKGRKSFCSISCAVTYNNSNNLSEKAKKNISKSLLPNMQDLVLVTQMSILHLEKL